MNVHKYANLPDIDTAPDVYETEDVAPSSQAHKDSSDDEGIAPTRSAIRGKTTEASKEEVDSSHLMGAEEASKKFRRAEKRRERMRTHYMYPPSPTSSDDEDEDASKRKQVSLSHRLKSLQAEMQSLEAELADPSNPLLQDEKDEGVDPGELIRGLVDVKRRLDKVRKEKEGRGRLVGVVLGQQQHPKDATISPEDETPKETEAKDSEGKPVSKNVAEMDRRVGMLEKLVGSTAAPLDETSPLPPPLLPQISRLSAQLGVLTQPRHIDSISRRLKLLLAELERTNQHRRHGSQSNANAPPAPSMQEQILPLLNRLGPSLPQIPHILMRLRTLSALHTSASEFENTLKGLEDEQQKMRDSIAELESAVEKLEINLEENRKVVTGNVTGLEERVGSLMDRMK